VSDSLDMRAVGDRIEALLAEVRASVDRPTWELVEDTIASVTELYGGGLARILELVSADDVGRLMADDLVASLLILHGLHPLDLAARVDAALESVRPYLGSHGGDVEVLEIDEQHGVLRLRMLGTCDGCPSSSVTLQMAVREAIEAGAPEIVHIEVDPEPGLESAAPATVETPVTLVRKPVAAR